MNEFTLIFAAFFGATAIIFGAFGAHLLKKKLSVDLLQSLETGVKYQMYHAIVLLVLGFQLKIDSILNKTIFLAFIIGTVLFSFSIYGLVISSAKNKKLRFLGPITPLGGLFLIIGWVLFLYQFILNL